MTNRARFVLLGAVVLAVVLFVPDFARYAVAPVPTEHQPALLLSFDQRQTDVVSQQVQALDGVVRTEFELIDTGAMDEPRISGEVHYDGFMLFWRPEARFDGFDTLVRPVKRRFAGEPDPDRVDEAMRELETLFMGLDHGSGLFISDADMRQSSAVGED